MQSSQHTHSAQRRARPLSNKRLLLSLSALLFVQPVSGQTPSDSTAAADSVAVQLAALEVVGSILHAVGGPRVRSGLNGRALTLDAAAVRAWRPRLLGAVLAREAGATLYDDLGSPFKQTLIMGGFAASPVVGLPQGVTVLVDGIPMNEPGAGEVSFDLLPLEFTQRVEVLNGTASLLGPNSLGGAVNLVTAHGGGSRSGHVELSAGSHGFFGGNALSAGRVAGLDYTAGAVHERERGWRDDMRGERTVILASAALPGQGRGARVLAFAARSRAETAGSLPLSVYRVRPDSNLTAGDFELLRQVSIGVSGYTELGAGTASLRLYGRVADAERFNVNQQADPDVRGFTDSRTLGLDSDWIVTSAAGRMTLQLRVGGGGVLNHTAIALHAERVDPHQTTDVSSAISRVDAYAMAMLGAGPATVSAGARWDAIRVPFRNLMNPERDTTSTFTHLSPRLGASVTLAPRLFIYASAGRNFRPPALIEIACADPEEPCPLPFALGDDPPIAPVRVTTFEAGLSWMPATFELQLSAYRSEVTDDIFLFPYDDEEEPAGSTIDGYFDNVPHTRRDGLQASAHARIGAGHRAFATYTFSRATFRTAGIEIFSIREAAGAQNEVHTGSRFPLVPDHALSLGADVSLSRGISAGAFVHHVGRRYLRGDEANDEPPLDAYTTLDARAAVTFGPWRLDTVLRNVTDQKYHAFGTFNINQGAGNTVERFVTPGAPRRLEMALRRTF